MTYTIDDILGMDKIFRLNLINSVSGYKSANLVGTRNENAINNLAIFSSVIHMGSNPPLLAMNLRPTSVPRHTFANIEKTGFYTINHINRDMIAAAHQTSAKYDEEISEFEAVGLTPEFINGFDAPFVKESVVKMAMELQEVIDVKSNGTKLIIGKINQLIAPGHFILEDGILNLNECQTVAISGLDTYHLPQKLARFGYARPK